ncbi:MAG: hypothetical protein A2283_11610 [Lentisphaerae bacterium RIFOXYA12_FULL_48_11]|nr:MAG: hypothetical protein A2283_11610 [Lentisphaerae bacterium RIFOXYA12_FULL_48_11]
MSGENSQNGINVHLPYNRLGILDRCKGSGIAWVRIDLNWDSIELSKGQCNFDQANLVVQKAKALGLNIFATLAYSPKWANGSKEHQYPPVDAQDWGRFVTNVVTHFKNDIKHWGIWNEPNLPSFFGGTFDEYISKILIVGAKAAKNADPSCKVLGPDLSSYIDKNNAGSSWCIWLKRILQNSEARDCIDIISHHIYSWPDKPVEFFFWNRMEQDVFRQLDGTSRIGDKWSESLKSILEGCGSSKKEVWITETGREWKGAGGKEIGLTAQGKLYPAFLNSMAKRSWMKKVFFYEVLDDSKVVTPMYFGILNEDASFSPRPAMQEYSKWIKDHLSV